MNSPSSLSSSPYRIGLTGGIATGKSTVADYLAQKYHIPILDADLYAREAVQPHSPILGAIAQRYGPAVIHPDGTLNRRQVGEIIFSQPQERQWLESQIHPFVRHRFLQEIATLNTATVLLVIPLLFEANMTDLVQEIWVVACSPEEQLARLMQRDHLPLEQAKARISSQMPLTEKIALADVVIHNNSTLENIHKQIDHLF